MGLSKAYDELIDNPEFSNGLIIPSGQAISDNSNNQRFKIDPNGTEILNSSGERGLRVDNGQEGGFLIQSGGVSNSLLQDDNGGFAALRYSTSASAPGTLKLTNAKLDLSGNRIQDGKGRTFYDEEPSVQQTPITISQEDSTFAIVFGESNNNVTIEFVDMVGHSYDRNSVFNTINRNNPASRTYTSSPDGSGHLEVSMDSGDYSVGYWVMGTNPQGI